jgi:hypothetical protein
MRALRSGEIIRRRDLKRSRHDGRLAVRGEQRDDFACLRAALMCALRPRMRCRPVRRRLVH